MSDKTRFKKRRQLLRTRGLCERCGNEKAMPGCRIGELCAAEMKTKKIVAPTRVHRCEKIARLERNRALFVAALEAVDAKLAKLRA